MNTDVTASCHCGAVILKATLKAGPEAGMRCTCSFCRRKQAANVSADVNDLEVVKGQDVLSLYQFGTSTAQHYFCSVCGIYTHHRRRADTSEYGVNLGCVEGLNVWEHEPYVWTDGINHPSDASDISRE